MTRAKFLLSILVAIIFLAMQVIAVGAAPASQETTPITGTVDNIILETDTKTGTTTVVVTLTNEEGTQTVRLSLEDATLLGLVKDDGAGNLIADETKYSTIAEIDPATVIPDETDGTTEEEPQHPVGSAISDFFSELLGVDYETVMDYHDNGAGFGVIAQALWMTNALEGDSETFAAILEAKQTKDYSGITLPDGSTPTNWGQFRKAVMSDREKAKENLGAIMSGRAENAQNQEGQTELNNNGNAPGNGNGNSNNGNTIGNSNDNSNSSNSNAPDNNNNNNGNGNDKDKNKDKNKDKDKDKGNDKNN
ncbi:MAG: hypothetical protein JW963_13270 [Anaerolineales bacterium]|nr:hypothetical protein [Anaerolineales bacterium]